MARKLRIEYPGAIYHVMSRGDRREPIFLSDADREAFLATLEEACEKTSWQVQAYCLMPNHFHLVIETPVANLVAGMKWLLGTYTIRFNHRHRLSGHLFAGRYKALVVDGSGNGYLRTVTEYVHLNPARAKLLAPEKPLRAYPWSSFPQYLLAPTDRAPWLRVDRVLGELAIPQDSAAGRRQFEALMERRRQQAQDTDWDSVRRGWCIGDETFKSELLAARTHSSARPAGVGPLATPEERAEQVIRGELKRAGWSEMDLVQARKGDPVKIALAQRLRRETTMTIKWIAQRLNMGTWTHLNNRLYWSRRAKPAPEAKRPKPAQPALRPAIPVTTAVESPFNVSWD